MLQNTIVNWVFIEHSISDALNETRDKVRYLDSMKRNLDQLYSGATPSTIINSALPGILTAIKQFDSVSRYYARQGFLGTFFTKVRILILVIILFGLFYQYIVLNSTV